MASDPLDINRYRVEKLPEINRRGFEKWMARIGGPLAIVVFILLYFVLNIPFLDRIEPQTLTGSAPERFAELGAAAFSRINYAMLAIFAAGITLWITQAIPNYLTSLIVIAALILTGVLPEKEALQQLGHPVMWLNILSFIMAGVLVKTRVAKRFALWLVVTFGKSIAGVILSFVLINLILSAFISATTAKAAILMPVFMVVAAIYGATGGKNRNNAGRNIVLQNLFQINLGANGFLTGSGATLLAGALMAGALGKDFFPYTDWLVAALPMSILLILIAWLVGTRLVFPIKKEERVPRIEGGLDRLKEELRRMGPVNRQEYKAIIIFSCVLLLWVTERLHGLSPTLVVFLGAVVALLPGIGIVKWNDVDIPWHLMLFSAGAYTLGAGLNGTGLPGILARELFNAVGITQQTPFWVIYVLLTGTMLVSALLFQSKTMQTLLFVPIAISVAQQFGYPVMSLAFPVALLIGHVYVLPFNSKPAALLYTSDQYSLGDSFRFGMVMMAVTWGVIILWGETVLRWLGYTNGVF
jgi:anion transporter